MTVIVPFRAALGFAATVFASSLAIEARAQDASPWQRDGHSAVRLLAGSRSGAVLLCGIAFQLQPGWKTYWRTPGDSGVPPRFDFAKSDNIEAVTILWPAPGKFPEGAGGNSLGYHHTALLKREKNAEKAGDVAGGHQLRCLREALRSGRGQRRARLQQRRKHRGRR